MEYPHQLVLYTRQWPNQETVAQLPDVTRALDELGTGGARRCFDYIGSGVLHQSMYPGLPRLSFASVEMPRPILACP